MHCRKRNSITGLYPLGTNSTFPSCDNNKNVSKCCQMPPAGQNHPIWGPGKKGNLENAHPLRVLQILRRYLGFHKEEQILPRVWNSLIAQSVKSLTPMQETCVQSLGWEDLLEKEMATHSSILAWRIPWSEEPGGPQSMGSQELDMTERLSTHSIEFKRPRQPS